MTRPRAHRSAWRPRRALVLLLLLAAAAAVVVLLFTVVFPWFDATFIEDPVMGRAGSP